MTTAAPFGQPLYVMLKPAGPMCNLACHYCYYLEKRELYPTDKHPTMSKELLEEFTRQYIEAQTMPQVLFTWHGGEALLRSVDFYQHALKLQRRYARGRQIPRNRFSGIQHGKRRHEEHWRHHTEKLSQSDGSPGFGKRMGSSWQK